MDIKKDQKHAREKKGRDEGRTEDQNRTKKGLNWLSKGGMGQIEG